jgi:capsular exopolysaccharide synthesis family protein
MLKDMIVHEAPKSSVSEAIRNLRTSLMYKMTKSSAKSFLVTSSSTEEGKSWIISNLAIAFSQSKQKVLIIDCDLRRGRQHDIFKVSNEYGLAQALDNKNIDKENENLKAEINKLIIKTEIDNVSLIPAGIVPHNPSELFENSKFGLILENLKDDFDIIFFDAPPINVVTDSMILCNKADGVIMVCAIERSKRDALVETKKKIINMGGNIVGVVVNRMPVEKMKEYTKDYSRYSDNQLIKFENKNKRGVS